MIFSLCLHGLVSDQQSEGDESVCQPRKSGDGEEEASLGSGRIGREVRGGEGRSC